MPARQLRNYSMVSLFILTINWSAHFLNRTHRNQYLLRYFMIQKLDEKKSINCQQNLF